MRSLKESSQLVNSLLVTTPEDSSGQTQKKRGLNFLTGAILRLMAFQFNYRPALRKYLKGKDGWINFSVGIKTRTTSVEQAIIFHDGRVRVLRSIPAKVDVTLNLLNDDVLKEVATGTPNELLNLILKNKIILDGNLAVMQLFNFYLSLMLANINRKRLAKSNQEDLASRKRDYQVTTPNLPQALLERRKYRMQGERGADKGVRYLDDPYLPQYSLEDFPRLQEFLDHHFNTRPEICVERPKLMTEWFREHGFETDNEGNPWCPELRQALALNYLLEKRKPIIRQNDLLAGTTTANEVGVTLFPDGHATQIWGELHTLEDRILNPCVCSAESAKILHEEVFPFWVHRNFREYARRNYNYPLCQKLDERWVAYFVWKSVGISHTIPNFKRLLEKGTLGIITDIDRELETPKHDAKGRDSLEAMKITLLGINRYAANLAQEATRLAHIEVDAKRKEELQTLATICGKVPAMPAETLDEAMNAMWIVWTAIHMENSNTGTSLGRLDQWLQPYFERDIAKLNTQEERKAYIKHAIELTGCFYMRLTDHVPLLPDIANYLFGGVIDSSHHRGWHYP